jgi:hypothetical protein
MYRRGGHFFYAAVLPAWGWVLIAVVGMALLVVVGALVIRAGGRRKPGGRIYPSRSGAPWRSLKARCGPCSPSMAGG